MKRFDTHHASPGAPLRSTLLQGTLGLMLFAALVLAGCDSSSSVDEAPGPVEASPLMQTQMKTLESHAEARPQSMHVDLDSLIGTTKSYDLAVGAFDDSAGFDEVVAEGQLDLTFVGYASGDRVEVDVMLQLDGTELEFTSKPTLRPNGFMAINGSDMVSGMRERAFLAGILSPEARMYDGVIEGTLLPEGLDMGEFRATLQGGGNGGNGGDFGELPGSTQAFNFEVRTFSSTPLGEFELVVAEGELELAFGEVEATGRLPVDATLTIGESSASVPGSVLYADGGYRLTLFEDGSGEPLFVSGLLDLENGELTGIADGLQLFGLENLNRFRALLENAGGADASIAVGDPTDLYGNTYTYGFEVDVENQDGQTETVTGTAELAFGQPLEEDPEGPLSVDDAPVEGTLTLARGDGDSVTVTTEGLDAFLSPDGQLQLGTPNGADMGTLALKFDEALGGFRSDSSTFAGLEVSNVTLKPIQN